MLPKKYNKLFMNYLKKSCDDCTISNKSLGLLIRSLHLNTPFNMLFIVYFAPKIFVILNTLILFISASFFLLFDGCFLSRLEYYLCKDSFTIVDPFLELLGMEINNTTRNYLTYFVMTFYIYIYFSICYFRFK